jgi:hypothetical protein
MAINRAPFNALIDDDGSNTVGSIWNKTAIKDVILDPVDAALVAQGAWASYVPPWGASGGTVPVLGNGVLVGRYLRVGQWVDLVVTLTMGSTTTYGSGAFWSLGLPFAPVLSGAPTTELTFRVGAMTGAGATQPPLIGYYIGANQVYLVTSVGGLVNPTTPFTWSTGAILSMRGSYEVL